MRRVILTLEPMHRSQIFFISVAAYILGLTVRSFWNFPEIILPILAVLAVSAFCVFYRRRPAMIFSLLILMLALGSARVELALDKIEKYGKAEGNYIGPAVVIKEPERKEDYQNLVLLAGDDQKILARENIYAPVSYGDEFKISCRLETVANKDQEFDYRMYLAKDGIYFICEEKKMEKTGAEKASRFYGSILKIKNTLQKTVEEALPYPPSALGSGLLFGGSGQLPTALRNDFSRTGLTHIVAVSGFNVTIIAQYLILFGIAIGLWRKQAFWFALFGILLFVAMIGFPSSAVRAGVMGSLLLWAMKNGRLANSWNAIAAAGAVMLTINPLLLRWDTGFQLSFLATIGIVSFSPLWEIISRKKFRGMGFGEIVFLTLSAQVLVVPLIAYQFHTFSAISLLANLLVLPIIPFLMLLVFLVAAAGAVWMPLGMAFSWLAFFILKYVIEITRYLSGLPFASYQISRLPIPLIILWYLFFALVIWRVRKINARSGS